MEKVEGGRRKGKNDVNTVYLCMKFSKKYFKEKDEERAWREGRMLGELQVVALFQDWKNQWVPTSEEHQGHLPGDALQPPGTAAGLCVQCTPTVHVARLGKPKSSKGCHRAHGHPKHWRFCGSLR